MQANNNPLRQYFRRPSIYLKLPSRGVGYNLGVVDIPDNGEIPIYPMTAIDEITSRTPDALFNGEAIASLIKSCAPAINNPWELNSVDLEALLVAIKTASNGNKIEIETTCPACEEGAKYDINLVGMLADLRTDQYDQEYRIDDLSIKLKPIVFKELNEVGIEQFEIQKMLNQLLSSENPTDAINGEKYKQAILATTRLTMKTLAKGIEYIKTPEAFVDDKNFIMEFLSNCDKNIFEKIKDISVSLKKNSQIKPLKLKCIKCAHSYEQEFTLNISDFFA